MAKDRKQTERQILDAVGTLLSREGFASIGINAVAREAGVDKVLIYRYFGDLRGLLEAFVDKGDHWPDLISTYREGAEPAGDLPPGTAAACRFLSGHLRQMRKRALTREIMCWELVQKSPLGEMIARKREQQSEALAGGVGGEARGEPDAAAVAAIVHAGITYLNLRSRLVDVYMGVDLKDESGWKRLEKAACEIMSSWTAANPAAEALFCRLFAEKMGEEPST